MITSGVFHPTDGVQSKAVPPPSARAAPLLNTPVVRLAKPVGAKPTAAPTFPPPFTSPVLTEPVLVIRVRVTAAVNVTVVKVIDAELNHSTHHRADRARVRELIGRSKSGRIDSATYPVLTVAAPLTVTAPACTARLVWACRLPLVLKTRVVSESRALVENCTKPLMASGLAKPAEGVHCTVPVPPSASSTPPVYVPDTKVAVPVGAKPMVAPLKEPPSTVPVVALPVLVLRVSTTPATKVTPAVRSMGAVLKYNKKHDGRDELETRLCDRRGRGKLTRCRGCMCRPP